MLRRLPLLALLLLVLPAPLAASDPGSSDAPEERASAPLLGLGEHAGDMPLGDAADWYRVELPEGWSLDARLDIAGQDDPAGFLTLHDAAGEYLVASYATQEHGARVQGGHGAVYLRVTPWGGSDQAPFTYALTLALGKTPDFAITDVDITAAPLAPGLPSIGAGVAHDVALTLVNHGEVGGEVTASILFWTPSDWRWTYVRVPVGFLAVGEERTVTVRWDSSRHVGDVEVRAYAQPDDDVAERDPDDNRRTVWHYGPAGSVRQGYTVR